MICQVVLFDRLGDQNPQKHYLGHPIKSHRSTRKSLLDEPAGNDSTNQGNEAQNRPPPEPPPQGRVYLLITNSEHTLGSVAMPYRPDFIEQYQRNRHTYASRHQCPQTQGRPESQWISASHRTGGGGAGPWHGGMADYLCFCQRTPSSFLGIF